MGGEFVYMEYIYTYLFLLKWRPCVAIGWGWFYEICTYEDYTHIHVRYRRCVMVADQ
jgi:hypothetical protein